MIVPEQWGKLLEGHTVLETTSFNPGDFSYTNNNDFLSNLLYYKKVYSRDPIPLKERRLEPNYLGLKILKKVRAHEIACLTVWLLESKLLALKTPVLVDASLSALTSPTRTPIPDFWVDRFYLLDSNDSREIINASSIALEPKKPITKGICWLTCDPKGVIQIKELSKPPRKYVRRKP